MFYRNAKPSLKRKRIALKKSKEALESTDDDSEDEESKQSKVSKRKPSNALTTSRDKSSSRSKVAGVPQNADASKKFDFATLAFTSPDGRGADVWGQYLPEGILFQIFKEVVASNGALPFLCRLDL